MLRYTHTPLGRHPPADTPPPNTTGYGVNKWAVHILLECILDTACNEVAQGNVFICVCDSVHRGGLCPSMHHRSHDHGGLCTGGLCPSMHHMSHDQGGLCPMGLVQGGLCWGGLCPGGVCPGGSLSRGSLSIQGSLSGGSLLGRLHIR